MSNRGYANRSKRKKHIPIIENFCKDNGLTYEFLAGDWHIRIEKVLDIYPTRMRWHWLPTQERGTIEDYDDIGRIFMEHVK